MKSILALSALNVGLVLSSSVLEFPNIIKDTQQVQLVYFNSTRASASIHDYEYEYILDHTERWFDRLDRVAAVNASASYALQMHLYNSDTTITSTIAIKPTPVTNNTEYITKNIQQQQQQQQQQQNDIPTPTPTPLPSPKPSPKPSPTQVTKRKQKRNTQAFCSANNILDGFGCDDGDACTINDVCVSGKCTGGQKAKVSCSNTIECQDLVEGLGSCFTVSATKCHQGQCIFEKSPVGTACPFGHCDSSARCQHIVVEKYGHSRSTAPGQLFVSIYVFMYIYIYKYACKRKQTSRISFNCENTNMTNTNTLYFI